MRTTSDPTSARAIAGLSEAAITRHASVSEPCNICASGASGTDSITPATIERRKRAAQQHCAVTRLDLARDLPAEHGPAVEQRDALHCGLEVRVERGEAAAHECVPRVGLEEGGGDRLGHLPLHQFEHLAEQVILAGEVVVEGALRDARGRDDLVDRRLREAGAPEQLAPDLEQRSPGLGALGDFLVDMHTVRMYHTDCRYLTTPT